LQGTTIKAIYAFQGASPSEFINLKGVIDAQVESRRVPKQIHKLAVSVLMNIDERLQKTMEPKRR